MPEFTDPPRFGVRVVREVRIPMRDGVRLAATLHLPDAEGRYPALLESLPYRKDDLYWTDAGPAHHYFAARGYVGVRLDVRGTGSSEGVSTDEYSEAEQRDTVEAIAWLAAQPWCTGAVGMFGISYGGFTSLQAATHAPPALKAIVPSSSSHVLPHKVAYSPHVRHRRAAKTSTSAVRTGVASEGPDGDAGSRRCTGRRWRASCPGGFGESVALVAASELLGCTDNSPGRTCTGKSTAPFTAR